MILALTPRILLLLLLLQNSITKQTYLLLEQKNPQNFSFQINKITSPFSYHSHYSLNPLYTVDIIRTFDPVKQYYILAPFHSPTCPIFVRQEALNLNDDFL